MTTFDYSEQIAFAVNCARRRYPLAFRLFPSDAKQTAIVGALSAEVSTYQAVSREVNRAMRGLMTDLMGRREDSPGDILRRRSFRASRMWTAQRLRAVGVDVRDCASRTGLAINTINRFTRSSRTPEEVHRLRSEGGKAGGKLGAIARWGDFENRRMKARALRSAGCTLREIKDACGYKSLSAVHYATKEIQSCC